MWRVIYRTGGAGRTIWRLVSTVYSYEATARAAAELVEKMGYRAIVQSQDTLSVIGLPIGWEPNSVDWERDKIVVTPYQTLWEARV